MAFGCSWCGSVNTQAGLDKRQCLACGELTNADGSRAVPTVSKTVFVPAEHGDVESGDRRYRPGDVIPGTSEAPAAPTATETAEPEVVNSPAAPTADAAGQVEPAPIDLSSLSPEQVAAIELIAHSEETQ